MRLMSIRDWLFDRLPISRQFSENVVWRAIQKVSSLGARMLIFFIAAKLFTPRTFGRYNYLTTVIAFLTVFSKFGLGESVSKFVAEDDDGSRMSTILVSSFTMCLLLSAAIAVVVVSIGTVYLDDSYHRYIAYFLPLVLFTGVVEVYDGKFRGQKRFRTLSTTFLAVAGSTLLVAPFLIGTFGIRGALGAQILYYAAIFAVLAYRSENFESSFQRETASNLVRYAGVIGISDVAYFLFTYADVFVLEFYNFTTEIGYYGIIDKIFMFVYLPFLIVGRVLAPDVSRLAMADRYGELLTKFERLKYVFASGVVLTVLLYVLVPPVIRFAFPKYYTPTFVRALNVLLLLVPFKITSVLSTNGYVVPSGFAKITTAATAIGAIANIALDFVAVPIFGFVGVFYVTVGVHAIVQVAGMGVFYVMIRDRANRE